jgi:YtkA-like
VKRLFVSLAAGTAGLLPLAVPHLAVAGGWAVTTLDPMETPAPGEQVDVGFTIRQHGVTPVAVADVEVLVTDASGATEAFAAHQQGATGHYVAPVTFPAAGSYRWTVE